MEVCLKLDNIKLENSLHTEVSSNSKTLYLKINPRRRESFDCDSVAHLLSQEDSASGPPSLTQIPMRGMSYLLPNL